MYVRRLKLENIRPFKELDFEFDRPDASPESTADQYRGWNVIAGDNASGKSTLLRALALALIGPSLSHTLVPSFNGWIRQGADKGYIGVEIAFGDEDRFKGGGMRSKEPIWAELNLIRRGTVVELVPKQGHLKATNNGPWAAEQAGWFSAAYGPFRRLFGHSPQAARIMAIPGKAPRYATLFMEDATLAEATNWLQELQFKALEKHDKERDLLADVLLLLNDDFLRRGFRVQEVNSDGLWLQNEQEIRLALAEMSDGYRSALALLIDLVRHMVAVYGGKGILQRNSDTTNYFVPHSGVVLIDEVDSHLHPEWQRLIGDWLKRRFPAIQFITTSHSPFVVQATDPGGLYRLPTPGESERPERVSEESRCRSVIGTADEVLRGAPFNMEHTRSPETVAARGEYSRLVARDAAQPLDAQGKARLRQLALFAPEE